MEITCITFLSEKIKFQYISDIHISDTYLILNSLKMFSGLGLPLHFLHPLAVSYIKSHFIFILFNII